MMTDPSTRGPKVIKESQIKRIPLSQGQVTMPRQTNRADGETKWVVRK